MKFIPNAQNIEELGKTVDRHTDLLVEQNEELKKTKNITFFFTVIVGITLVATLVGLGGIYISALYKNNPDRCGQDGIQNVSSREFYELKSDFLILKAKNSYLK